MELNSLLESVNETKFCAKFNNGFQFVNTSNGFPKVGIPSHSPVLQQKVVHMVVALGVKRQQRNAGM